MRELPAVTGLFETHLTVSDLDRAVAFGYPADTRIDGIARRDRVWLDLHLDAPC